MKLKKKIIFRRKKNPFFSIVTVVKNDEKNILKTLSSISGQTFKNYEHIVVDGLSQDNTINKLLLKKKKINVLISENDHGIYYAMNKGMFLAKGKIIVYVNSGDILTKNALKIISKKFNSLKSLDFVFGTVKRHYTNSTILKYGFNEKKLLYNFDFATAHSTGFFVKRKKIIEIGGFNTKYKYSADYDFYFKAIIKKKLKGDFTKKNELIGIVQSGGFSSQISFLSHLLEECKIRLDNKQNFIFVFVIFINAIFKFILKKLF